jgi:hypothetical protein
METHLDRLKTLISQIKALKAEKDKILKTPTTPGTTGTTGTITQTELPTCDESQNFDATKCKCRGTTQPTGYCCKGRYFPTVKSAAECPEQDILKEALEAIDTLNK